MKHGRDELRVNARDRARLAPAWGEGSQSNGI